MDYAFRKILSNITYFAKTNEDRAKGSLTSRRRHNTQAEPDGTLKETTAADHGNIITKKGSHSDTDILSANEQKKRKIRKLKLDVKKASQSMTRSLDFTNNDDDGSNAENTPKHKLLDCKSAEVFSFRLKRFNFDSSFDLPDSPTDSSSRTEEIVEIDSYSDPSDTEDSSEKKEVKMCRKVEQEPDTHSESTSVSPEPFEDLEDKNEEERISLLLNYQMRLEKLECFLQKLLNEFQFHIEVSKIFNAKSIVTAPSGTDVTRIPKILGQVTHADNTTRGVSPSWNIIVEKEDSSSKNKLKQQLLAMKETIDTFINLYLDHRRKGLTVLRKSYRIQRGKSAKMTIKKKMKHYDFPDLREAMINLFGTESEKEELSVSMHNAGHLFSESDSSECNCKCHYSPSDSGLTSKDTNQSITSSIGNFTMDSNTLSAYSESLDMIVSYNSFDDSTLSILQQKTAIERITFYVQAHSIQINCEADEFESKNILTFHCPACNISEVDEECLLKHILSQKHCEKIHFLYKTAYIKKCVASGKEIMPSTVLNPMTLYRDGNKIVCFGDAMYACTLCFENLIVGESVLMAHCYDKNHVNRKETLSELFE